MNHLGNRKLHEIDGTKFIKNYCSHSFPLNGTKTVDQTREKRGDQKRTHTPYMYISIGSLKHWLCPKTWTPNASAFKIVKPIDR